MKLGFVGTGAIASAMVTGLRAAIVDPLSICLSPRNAALSSELARRFPQVEVASSNQGVVDACDTVVLAIRPQIAQEVIAALRFRPEHHCISLVAGLPLGRLAELVHPATRITKAVPLPAVANRKSPTPIYPRDEAAVRLFSLLGTAFVVNSEEEFNALSSSTASIASLFAFADGVASWLARHGVSEAQARDYVGRVLSAVVDGMVDAPNRSFESLAADYATRGGINEQALRHLEKQRVFESVSEALDAVLKRIAASG